MHTNKGIVQCRRKKNGPKNRTKEAVLRQLILVETKTGIGGIYTLAGLQKNKDDL